MNLSKIILLVFFFSKSTSTIVVDVEQFNVTTAHLLSIHLHGMRYIFTRIKIDFRLTRVLSFIVQYHFAMRWLNGVKELRAKQNMPKV